ncbi:hypothetical protein [Arthrobacter sp. HY1533]|uniref:hypothetical protein n=1 Tax=Arthrobacter sp. HY1533 TaxID=2970919 RepID=UPI0022BA1140|nr:hypothetical protein [Arthrobacter sp. HY1533]
MGVFVLVSPLAAPVPPAPIVDNPWPGMVLTWTGWDGSVWQLNAATSGVALLPGVRGFGTPPTTIYSKSSPAVAGSQHLGSSVEERKVFWPLAVWRNTSSAEWIAHDRAFFRTMDTEQPGIWTVRQPNGEARNLRIRYVDDGNKDFDVDPSKYGIETYGLNFIANQPYWEGAPVRRRFVAASPAPFFSGPIVTISSGKSLATATVSNPGEVNAFPVWTILGPTTSATVGIGGMSIEVPFTIADGEAAVIDTHPTAQTCLLGDWDDTTRTLSGVVDRSGDLGAADFNMPIPPGLNLQLALSMTGTGAVDIEISPLFKRAW